MGLLDNLFAGQTNDPADDEWRRAALEELLARGMVAPGSVSNDPAENARHGAVGFVPSRSRGDIPRPMLIDEPSPAEPPAPSAIPAPMPMAPPAGSGPMDDAASPWRPAPPPPMGETNVPDRAAPGTPYSPPATTAGWSPTVAPAAATATAPDTMPGKGGGDPAGRTPTAWDRFGAFVNAPSLFGGIHAAGDLDRRFADQNATSTALAAKLGDPVLARAVMNDPDAFKAVLPTLFGGKAAWEKIEYIDDSGRKVVGLYDKANPTKIVKLGLGASDEKAPSGYRWKNPSDPRAGVERIPGVEETIPVETSGKIAMMNVARDEIARTRGAFDRAWSTGDMAKWAAANVPGVGDIAYLSGDIGEAQRSIYMGIESVLRTMTGAAAPKEEVTNYSRMFMPGPNDTPQSTKQKLDGLIQFMNNAEKLALRGRMSIDEAGALLRQAATAPAAAAARAPGASASSAPTRLRFDPSTGTIGSR